MPATSNSKQRLVNQIFSTLPKHLDVKEGPGGKPETQPVLEQFIYAVCRQGATRAVADHAFRKLRENFFDWNEVRVSSVREIADALDELPHPEARAQKIIDFLQEVFELNFSFDLESLHKKGLKVAAKQLARYQAADDYNVPWVIQRSLGGHAMPVDEGTERTLRRLGLLDSETSDGEAVRSSLEHQIPKAKGPLFTDLISVLAAEFCHEEPQCRNCPLSSQCPKNMETALAECRPQTAGV